MAIYKGKCVYEIYFVVPEIPSKMQTIIATKSGNIMSQMNVLPSRNFDYPSSISNAILHAKQSKNTNLDDAFVSTEFDKRQSGNTNIYLQFVFTT